MRNTRIFIIVSLFVASGTVFVSCGKTEEPKKIYAASCEASQSGTVYPQSRVKIEITSKRVSDGAILESENGSGALLFDLGNGRFPQSLEESLYCMKVGESKTVTLPPKDAYGEKMLKSEFVKAAFAGVTSDIKEDTDYELSPGMKVHVSEVDGDKVMVDQPNPNPLAGETIEYAVKVVEVKG